MQNTTKDDMAYCKELIKKMSYDRYLQCIAFVTEPTRSKLIAFFAFEAELKHVRHAVSEEMLGHIRYAWWQEAIEGLDNPREHPVLQALKKNDVPREMLLTLAQRYREAYPELPADIETQTDMLGSDLVPEDKRERYIKVGRIIRAHKGGKLSLVFKLLFV
jgi:hypothetical protein